MPSQKVLEQKQQVVNELADRIQNSVAGIIVSYEGINVSDDTKLRKDLREAGVKYTVVKNTLIKRAAEKAGLNGIDDVLNGTSAIATSTKVASLTPTVLIPSPTPRKIEQGTFRIPMIRYIYICVFIFPDPLIN